MGNGKTETSAASPLQKLVSCDDFKKYVSENGYPAGVHWKCPRCGADTPDDDRPPIDGLMNWNANAMDAGGNGWMCVCCDNCGNHYAADISN